MWKNTKAILNIKETQTEFYKRNQACPEVLKLVDLESKSFGMRCEKIIREMFSLEKATNSQHDAICKGTKIEIKSARYWGGTTNCRFQHVELDYDYEYILFVLVEFQDLRIWGMNKDRLKEMINLGILTSQGRQGYWTKMSDILPHLTIIKSKEDLENALKEIL